MRNRKYNKRRPRLTSREVHAVSEKTLRRFVPLDDNGPKCTAPVLYGILLWAAARMLSIAAVCRNWTDGPTDQAVHDALDAQLPKRPRILENQLNRALVHRLPRGLFSRSRPVAIDYHDVPYYGKPQKHANEVHRGKPKQGTSTFHTYATLCIVHKGHRFTLGYTWVKRGEKQTAVVERLLRRVRELGLRIRRVLMDRGFFNAAMMRYLQQQGLPFLMPVVMRGRKPKPGKRSKGLRRYRRQAAGWYRHTMSCQGEPIRFRVCVAYKSYRHHKTGKRRRQKLIYAGWKVGGAPVEVRESYRRRFGIETSYRQRRQARIRTSTKDAKLRLLYVGLSFLLRNLWVWLHAEYLAEGSRIHPHPRLDKLRFSDMLEWLTDYIKAMLQVVTDYWIDCHTGKRFTATGTT